MAVTTKTLSPTNQVVSLPDMTERPNASVLVDGIGKDADAINALSDKMANKFGGLRLVNLGNINGTKTVTFTSSTNRFLLMAFGATSGRIGLWLCNCNVSSGAAKEIAASDSATVSWSEPTLTITTTRELAFHVLVIGGSQSYT